MHSLQAHRCGGAPPVGNVEVGAVEARLLGLQHALDELVLAGRQQADVVALLAQLLEHAEDGAKHVEVRGRAHVALVRREGEHGDGQLLLGVGLLAQARPVDGAHAQRRHAVGQGVRLAGVGVAAGKHNGLQRAVQLGQRHLGGCGVGQVCVWAQGTMDHVPKHYMWGLPAQGAGLFKRSTVKCPGRAAPSHAPGGRPARGGRRARCPATPRWSGTPAAATPGRAR